MNLPFSPEILLAAARQQQYNNLQVCFDSARPDSRPTEAQQAILDDIEKILHRYVVAGNQCNLKGTLIATPKGPKAIETIVPGDEVYSEHGTPIKVLNVFANGVKEVADLTARGVTYATCTKEHKWLCNTYSREDGSLLKAQECEAGSLSRQDAIQQVRVIAPLGSVYEPHAYAIAALLGDGCSKQGSNNTIYISSGNHYVPAKVAQVLGTTYRRQHSSNYTWSLQTGKCNHYNEWCRDRYAHEKIVDIEVIKTWDRQSLVQFVAGLIDTDGTVYANRDMVSMSLNMQAKSVVDAFEYAVLALWQVQLHRTIDARKKYKKGSVYVAYTRNMREIRYILKELDAYLATEHKRWKDSYNVVGGKRSREGVISLRYGANPRTAETYDLEVDSPTHLYLLANGLVTHNSGKSSLGARELSWILNGTHPTWKRPERWGTVPLFVIIAGQSRDIIEHGLWTTKLKPMLTGNWREVKKSGSLMSAINRDTGDKIVFLPHGDAAEDTISNMQTYVAHYVWLDEMPKKSKILTELLQRITAYGGYMFATFTPLSVSAEVKRIIDSVKAPYGRKYSISKLDNPLFAQDKERILQEAAGWSLAERMTRLYGAWAVAETAVYEFDYNRMCAPKPANYSTEWRHVISVDPASSSKTGLSIFAECPNTGIWYCLKADYLTIKDPKKLIHEIKALGQGINVVKWISDINPMFVSLAYSEAKITFVTPWNKTQRKDQLIKQLQIALSESKLLLTPGCELAIEEFDTCRHKEDESGNIVNAQRFHILDTFQYFVDCKPHPQKEYKPQGFNLHNYIMEEDDKRRRRELAQQRQKKVATKIRIRRRR